ncbi:ankyrin repeat-containing protein BDA1-like [Salvia splendens]|uniref:ankyrin repeat-containing protein BDA1-like n=1 Tax=Salvia splendens TaxID=180675 RepID=UPI001C27E2D0|nr:ankyrin repeat-containing protein BDA1-like [Salvia splendens]
MEEAKFAETPLHKAAAAGNTAVPDAVTRQEAGFGGAHRDTARFMAAFDRMLVRVKGKNGMTPLLLCAARAGNHDEEERRLLARLLIVCPESVRDVNNLKQTVVHVALVKQGCKTVCMLVDWLRRRNRISSVLSVKDLNGNTPLHAAAQFGCLGVNNGCFMFVVGGKKNSEIGEMVKLNRLNSERMSALDLAIKYNQSEVKKLLEEKGAKGSNEICEATTTTDYVLTDSAFSRAYYYLTEELTLELRNTILVVATLIPSREDSIPPTTHKPPRERTTRGRADGYGEGEVSLLHAVQHILVCPVDRDSPVFLILHLCLVFMCISYLLALDAISHYTVISNYVALVLSGESTPHRRGLVAAGTQCQSFQLL